MTAELIKNELLQLISELFKDKGFNLDLLEYANLVDDLGMDSITFISIVVEIEAHFNMEVPDNLLLMEYFRTVDDIVKIIEDRISLKIKEQGGIN